MMRLVNAMTRCSAVREALWHQTNFLQSNRTIWVGQWCARQVVRLQLGGLPLSRKGQVMAARGLPEREAQKKQRPRHAERGREPLSRGRMPSASTEADQVRRATEAPARSRGWTRRVGGGGNTPVRMGAS